MMTLSYLPGLNLVSFKHYFSHPEKSILISVRRENQSKNTVSVFSRHTKIDW